MANYWAKKFSIEGFDYRPQKDGKTLTWGERMFEVHAILNLFALIAEKVDPSTMQLVITKALYQTKYGDISNEEFQTLLGDEIQIETADPISIVNKK